MFWIYDVPGDETRGAHAYHRQNEVIVALSGSFTVVVHDGTYEQRYHLRRPDVALFLPPLSWRSMVEFSTNSLSLHLTDLSFNEADYIREFADYQLVMADKNN